MKRIPWRSAWRRLARLAGAGTIDDRASPARTSSRDAAAACHGPRAYDGIVHVHRSDGTAPPAPAGLLARVLGFEPDREGLQYALSFYAGGTGVTDTVAIRCRCTEPQREALTERMHLRDLEAIRSDARWVVDFAWLVGVETGTAFTRDDCEAFVDANRSGFQDAAAGCAELRFEHDSDVNSWSAVWLVDGHANVLGFDQG